VDAPHVIFGHTHRAGPLPADAPGEWRVDGAAAQRELAEPRRILERETGAPVTLFSFPYGGPNRMTAENRARVAQAGYRCCLSGYGGTVARGDDPYRLRRAPIGLWHLSPQHLGFELLFRPPADV
jgi:peptidoglycan/xylan/chitin deacetylase (PgdA/CDA1 family)